MGFTFSGVHLKRLCDINYFQPATGEMIFFGLRGCLPANADDNSFGAEHELGVKDLNYLNPRCTLGQWDPAKGKIAVFPGSTVPHQSLVKTSISKGGLGTNQLATGFYADYRKGVHKEGKPTGHQAFRQSEGRPIRRTSDDKDYQNDDRVEFSNPYDNLHAAWCQGLDSVNYASAGCQVVVGYPKCSKPNYTKDVGPWKTFKANAYLLTQDRFQYVLLDGKDAERVATATPSDKIPARLRYGSKGDLVADLQEALKKAGFYEGVIDDEFRERTLRAVMDYQSIRFGPLEDDGIVGPVTAAALGISWPKI
jgi:hypothetical protein